jgi:hypothetical protein
MDSITCIEIHDHPSILRPFLWFFLMESPSECWDTYQRPIPLASVQQHRKIPENGIELNLGAIIHTFFG